MGSGSSTSMKPIEIFSWSSKKKESPQSGPLEVYRNAERGTGVKKSDYDMFAASGGNIASNSVVTPLQISNPYIISDGSGGFDIADRYFPAPHTLYTKAKENGENVKFMSLSQDVIDHMTSMFARRKDAVQTSRAMPGANQTKTPLINIGN